MTELMRLGPFALVDRLARGGMGQIWRARHVVAGADGVPVAVKVLTTEAAKDPNFYHLFQQEVRAQARLRHPGIATVLDYGILPPRSSETDPELIGGSPFLVMEFASCGSLEDVPPACWDDLRATLLALLAALAHAHARGVIHRDLKPANVLICGPDDLRPGLKLTDFGIAHAGARVGDGPGDSEETMAPRREVATGTPQYMAPEQFEGKWREFGPWTDLYALGVLAYEMGSGQLPFDGDNVIALAWKHLREAPEPFVPAFPVAKGFESWVARLMQKDPERRFRHAADAAWALAQLEGPAITVDLGVTGPLAVATRPTFDGRDGAGTAPTLAQLTLPELGLDETGWSQMLARPALIPETLPLAVANRPPMPKTWRSHVRQRPLELLGAGLGLFGLRAIPVVDRDAPRDQLWDELARVSADRAARAILLTGPSGTGKSCLAQWLCERAHELGAATSMRALHEPMAGPSHGIGRMVASHLGCVGLEGESTVQHLEERLRSAGIDDAFEWQALAEITDSAAMEDRRSLRVRTPAQRYVLVERLLYRTSRTRPVIVWLDDVQWGHDALGLVEHVLAQQAERPVPVLFVLTARDDMLVGRALEAERLEALSAAGMRRMQVPPLADEDCAELVHELLGLSPALSAEVVDRVAGNPLFAVRVVGDWVHRGALQLSPHGFVLKAGESLALPDSLHQVWRAHLDRLLDGLPEGAVALVELAAVLGGAAEHKEFAVACANVDPTLGPDDVVAPLLAAGLAVQNETGWGLTHGMLRESLVRSAQEFGRWRQLNDACARMLAEIYPASAMGIAERRARHLLEAGRLADAIDPLRIAAEQHTARSEFAQAQELLGERELALERLNTWERDAAWGDGWVARAHIHRLAWQFDEADAWARRAAAGAATNAWPRVGAAALVIRAHCARQRRDLEDARRFHEEAGRYVEVADDPWLRADWTLSGAIVARVAGEHDLARHLYEEALGAFSRLSDDRKCAMCLYGLGNLHRTLQSYAVARAFYLRARDVTQRNADRNEEGNCVNALAEIARYEGRLDDAEQGYRDAMNLLGSIGSRGAILPQLNLALVLLHRGEYAAARDQLEPGIATLAARGQRGFLAWAQVCMLPCEAQAGEVAGWSDQLAGIRSLLEETAMVDPDVAWAARLAGDILSSAGHFAEARETYGLALAQTTSLGDESGAAKLQEVLRGLPG